jgi:alanine dehydrogenase
MVPTADEVFAAADLIAKVTVEQGGCIETSRPTTHSDPTFVEEGVTHYCVANILGAIAQTSTLALTSDDDVVRNWRVVCRGLTLRPYA